MCVCAEPGTFEFAKPSLLFKESAGRALIPVERTSGADGRVELKWKTEDMSAKAGKDYEAGDGVLVFEHGETTKTIEVALHDDQASGGGGGRGWGGSRRGAGSGGLGARRSTLPTPDILPTPDTLHPPIYTQYSFLNFMGRADYIMSCMNHMP